jgi:HD-GYP domain-containing protein (c-di-GMP phosphodiesterase class II)
VRCAHSDAADRSRLKFETVVPKCVASLRHLAALTAVTPTIATADLQVGMYVHLDLGWMSHPFALSSFRIADAAQIASIRALGLARVRWSPEHSDTATAASRSPVRHAGSHDPAPRLPTVEVPPATANPSAGAQRRVANLVERQYAEAARDWRATADLTVRDPEAAGQRMAALSQALVTKMLGARELSIRAVTAARNDGTRHATNVGVLALLMGRLCGLSEPEMQDLGVGALAHDIGKTELPVALHRADPHFTAAEMARYRDHVARGLNLGERMGLSPGAMLVIGQHHEHLDESGYPQGIGGQRISLPARLVALVNRYDNLCHGSARTLAMTPHEALSLLFSQGQRQYDPALLGAFVRMMGVYPPGSVVQLTDDRYAVVESVSASRPLRPKVQVHAPGAAQDDAPLLDLSQQRTLGIRRALPAEQLPSAVREQLMPLRRAAWFFEATDTGDAAPTPFFPTRH